MKTNIGRSVNLLQKNKITHLENEYPYLSTLNYEQQIAATSLDGNILVLAGPGSGKTHTLVYRIIHMLNSGIKPQEIVLITFTRKAANEIKNRVNRLVGNVKIGFIGTFHAFAIHISRMYKINTGWRILDTEDDIILLKMVIAENNIIFSQRITNKTILKIISYSSNTRKTIEESLIKLGRENLLGDVKNIEMTRSYYNHYKKRNKYMSYDDVIDSLIVKLGNNLNYQYLMVDEYQDTNQMQLEFINCLKIPNIMAIGDDFQGIYSFRGANPNIILNFSNDFPNAKLIILTTNYRSNAQIVKLLNTVIREAKIGYEKELNAFNKEKGIVTIKKLDDNYKEEFIEFYKNHQNEKTAFIYRANKDKAELEKELILNNIDYVVYGGIRLLERRHIKDIFAFLLVNKNKNDLISYLRVLLLLDGVGEKTAKEYLNDSLSRLNGRKDIIELEHLLNFQGDFKELLDLIINYYSSLNKPFKNCNYTEEELQSDYKMIKVLAEEFVDVINFINDVVLNNSIDMFSSKKKSNLVLTTIHSAKGLEFDNVFHLYAKPMYGNYDVASLEENRRLFYVAISRAKKNLVIWNFSYLDKVELNDILNDFRSYYNSSNFSTNNSVLNFKKEDNKSFGNTQITNENKTIVTTSQKKVSNFFSKLIKKISEANVEGNVKSSTSVNNIQKIDYFAIENSKKIQGKNTYAVRDKKDINFINDEIRLQIDFIKHYCKRNKISIPLIRANQLPKKRVGYSEGVEVCTFEYTPINSKDCYKGIVYTIKIETFPGKVVDLSNLTENQLIEHNNSDADDEYPFGLIKLNQNYQLVESTFHHWKNKNRTSYTITKLNNEYFMKKIEKGFLDVNKGSSLDKVVVIDNIKL